jgi:hypothetical protein
VFVVDPDMARDVLVGELSEYFDKTDMEDRINFVTSGMHAE